MADHARSDHLSHGVFRQVVGWIRSLPEGSVVPWSSPAMSPSRPFATLWAGVRVDDCPAASRFGWIWSFARAVPRDRRFDPLWVQAPADLEIHAYGVPDHAPVLLEWAVPIGSGWRPPAIPEPLPVNGRWLRTMAWSVEQITRTLSNWVILHTGRTDITFVWDPAANPVRMIDLVRLETAADTIGSDHDEFYQLGTTTYATGPVLDLLLQLDPAQAAEIAAVFSGS